MYNGYEFPERTTEEIIRYNAYSYGQDSDEAWAEYELEVHDRAVKELKLAEGDIIWISELEDRR